MIGMIYDPNEHAKLEKWIAKTDKKLDRYQRKKKLASLIRTRFRRAQLWCALGECDKCFQELDAVWALSTTDPTASLGRRWPFELIPSIQALAEELQTLYDLFDSILSEAERMREHTLVQASYQCAVAFGGGSRNLKTGWTVPLPLVTVKKRPLYDDIFSHYGRVVLSDWGISLFLLPSLFVLESRGSSGYDQGITHLGSFLHFEPVHIAWSELVFIQRDEFLVPGMKTVRITTRELVIDLLLFEARALRLERQTFADHKPLGYEHLMLRSAAFKGAAVGTLSKGYQRRFEQQLRR